MSFDISITLVTTTHSRICICVTIQGLIFFDQYVNLCTRRLLYVWFSCIPPYNIVWIKPVLQFFSSVWSPANDGYSLVIIGFFISLLRVSYGLYCLCLWSKKLDIVLFPVYNPRVERIFTGTEVRTTWTFIIIYKPGTTFARFCFMGTPEAVYSKCSSRHSLSCQMHEVLGIFRRA